MFKSEVIQMIGDNRQINGIKLAICYQYRTAGIHSAAGSGSSKALALKIYGIDKTGNGEVSEDTLLGICSLNTNASVAGSTGHETDPAYGYIPEYAAYGYAASVIVGLPINNYPAIYYTYDRSVATDFVKIIGQPMLFAEMREYPDMPDANNVTYV